MPSSKFSQIEEIVLRALEMDSAARYDWIRDHCPANFRSEVESLLAMDNNNGNFLDTPFLGNAEITVSESEVHGPVVENVGNYKIIREVARGGMGSVHLAVRNDDEYKKQVAIKILRRGMDTDDIIRRFRHERQILAGLDHPQIARLLDGGTTSDGLPYLVMEFIDGMPIDEFCERRGLGINERLTLFLSVCEAVNYAHQNLVVHRDLKPSNILITSEGKAKLLDFGIAKVLNPELSSQTINPTLTAMRMMTPDYASPEQVRGERITTASDVYSLGVLLFELLTAHRPYRVDSKAQFDLIKAICDEEPTRPSAVTDINPVPASRDQRSENDRKKALKDIIPLRSLRGDMDNIILTALRKEPERRYHSVETFAADIQRSLKGLPITARPNTYQYRAVKFVNRNKAGVLAATLVFLSMIGGIVVTSWQARQLRREKEKADSVNAFLEQTLKYSNPILSNLRKNGQETTVNDILDEAARQLESGKFDSSPEVKAELERTVGTTYIGRGNYQQARKHFEQYVLLLKSLYPENDPKMIAGSIVWADLLFTKGETDEAEKIYRRYLPLLKGEYQNGAVSPETLANMLNNFAYMRRTQGDSEEAESLFRETLELIPRLSDEEQNAVATTRSTLASTIADQGRFDEALKTARDAVDEYERRGETDSPNYGFSLNILGGFLTESGDDVEAEKKLRKAETIFRKLLSPNALWLGDNLRNQAFCLYGQHKYAEAVEKSDSTLKIYEESFSKKYDNYPTALIVKGSSLTKMGRSTEGEKVLRDALQLRTEALPAGHFWVAVAKSALGECLATENRFVEAEPLLLESYETLNTSQGARNPRTLLAQSRLADLYSRWNKPDLAAAYNLPK
ncbi:hypothetical protein BH10ACI3_BH10ACI3_09120 [soil metagenome]